MDSGDDYRAKAIKILLQADRIRDGETRMELMHIAAGYARLADHAEQVGSRLAWAATLNSHSNPQTKSR